MAIHGKTVKWSSQCVFIFQYLTTKTIEAFLIGCIITFLLCLLLNSLHKLRERVETSLFPQRFDADLAIAKQQLTTQQLILKHGIIPGVFGFSRAILYISILMILMQLNGFVLIFIILGYTTGFVLFKDTPIGQQESTMECH